LNSSTCHLCPNEAVARCYACGELVCAEHGKGKTCAGCTTAIAEGDPRGDRFSTVPLETKTHHGWWRPQEAEEYVPPACYSCQGLARGVCRNCESRYCAEHAGPNGICQACGRSAMLGVYVLVILGAVVVFVIVGHWLFG
jgi:hypothetical protein